MQYADDTELFVTDDESINQIFFELKCYKTATGAKVNVEKTEGLWPGSWKGRQDRPYNCKWTSGKVNVLGLWLGNQDTSGDIFNELYTKIKLNLAFWKGRNLSLIGRVRVINIYILSRLWYRTEIFSVPKNLLTEIEKDILHFIWKKKKHEINKQLLMSCEILGTFKGDYIGLEVFRADADMLKPKVVDPLY